VSVLEGSFAFRVGSRAGRWIERISQSSLVYRGLLAVVRGLSGASAGSRVLVTGNRPRPIAPSGHPVAVLAISRPYLHLRAAVGDVAERLHETLETAVVCSMCAGGGWTRIVGLGVFAFGGIRLMTASGLTGLELVLPAVLLVAGVLLLICGPRFSRAVSNASILRGIFLTGTALVEGAATRPSGEARVRRSAGNPGAEAEGRIGRVSLAAAMLLAALAGALIGLLDRSGLILVVGSIIAACALVLAFWRPQVLLLAIAAFCWLDWVARRSLGGLGSAWDEGFLLLSLVLVLWSVITRRRWTLWTVPITLPVVLALVAGFASIVVRHVPGNTGLFALRLLFQPILFYFIGFLLPKSKRWVQWTVALFVLTGVALAVHGLYQYATGAPIPAQWVDRLETGLSTRAYSIIDNPNGLGAFLLIGILVSMGLALSRGLSGVQRAAMAAACIIQLAGEVVTFSRGGWIGLAAGVLALLIVAYRRYLLPLVGAGVIAWFVMPSVVINRLTFAFSSSYIARSLAFGRLWVWGYALRQVTAHPLFGVGLGTFGGTTAVRFKYSNLWVDDFYLQLAAEGGLILLFLFLWVLLSAGRSLVQAHRATDDPYLSALAAGAFGAFVAIAAANLTASVWETLVVAAGFWFIAGLATSACFQIERVVSTKVGR